MNLINIDVIVSPLCITLDVNGVFRVDRFASPEALITHYNILNASNVNSLLRTGYANTDLLWQRDAAVYHVYTCSDCVCMATLRMRYIYNRFIAFYSEYSYSCHALLSMRPYCLIRKCKSDPRIPVQYIL